MVVGSNLSPGQQSLEDPIERENIRRQRRLLSVLLVGCGVRFLCLPAPNLACNRKARVRVNIARGKVRALAIGGIRRRHRGRWNGASTTVPPPLIVSVVI
jgi:hypothetical protein